MTCLLRNEKRSSAIRTRTKRTHWLRRITRATLTTGKRRRIQIVPEIKAHRANRGLVAYAYPEGVRNVAVVTLQGAAVLRAQARVLLTPAQQIVKQLMAVGKHVAGVVKDHKADVVLHEGQSGSREAQFEIVQEQGCPPEWKTAERIAWTCLIQPESAVGVAAARKKLFG